MEELYQHIRQAIIFFTRISIPQKDDGKSDHSSNLSDAAIAFPIVGFLIGAIIATVWLVASYVLPPMPAAAIAILCGLILTGCLHEDGLSDCADGLGGFASKERALEIMRDSRIGTYGSAALILSILLRWSALTSMNIWVGFSALICAHMISRAAITIPLCFSSYARKEGLASSVSDGLQLNQTLLITLCPALIILLLCGWLGLLALIIAYSMAGLVMKFLDRKIGGYTGDGLGAVQQVAEISFMLAIASLLT